MENFEPIVKTYYDALEEGKILARVCPECGATNFPPMPICQECSHIGTEWRELSGKATLLSFGAVIEMHAWAILRENLAPEDKPICWGELELEEGIHTTGVVIVGNDVDAVRAKLPLPVQAEIFQDDGFKTVIFRVVS